MFVGPTFADDRALDLMWVQHDLWFKIRDAWFDENGLAMGSCFYFFSCARKALLFSTDSNPLFFPERERLPSVTMFDHRVLQGAHDVIAAYYRWLVSGIKLPAFSDDKKEYRAYLLDSWKTYLRHEIAHITFGRLDLADHVVRAVVFENTTEGYAAEERLISALHERYGSMFRSERERFSDVSTAPSDNQGYIYVMVSPERKGSVLALWHNNNRRMVSGMARPLRIEFPLALYHAAVTTKGVRHESATKGVSSRIVARHERGQFSHCGITIIGVWLAAWRDPCELNSRQRSIT